MNFFHFIPLIALAICLSAACGFRVFLPPLGVGLAAHFGYMDVAGQGLDWLADWKTLSILGVASFIEFCSFYIPYLDNLLDTIASPLAVIAGVLISSSLLNELDPAFKWGLALIAGGGSSGLIQGTTVAIRAGSTGLTGGLGNFIVATLEVIFSAVLTFFAIFLPIIGVFFVIGLLYLGYLSIKKIKEKLLKKKTT
ncbi:MAG: DUF4126 domain-containing protein [Betaproteobacteria bacterium]|jgi:uncharacterized membrane protein YqaE (UPF0057 family)